MPRRRSSPSPGTRWHGELYGAARPSGVSPNPHHQWTDYRRDCVSSASIDVRWSRSPSGWTIVAAASARRGVCWPPPFATVRACFLFSNPGRQRSGPSFRDHTESSHLITGNPGSSAYGPACWRPHLGWGGGPSLRVFYNSNPIWPGCNYRGQFSGRRSISEQDALLGVRLELRRFP